MRRSRMFQLCCFLLNQSDNIADVSDFVYFTHQRHPLHLPFLGALLSLFSAPVLVHRFAHRSSPCAPFLGALLSLYFVYFTHQRHPLHLPFLGALLSRLAALIVNDVVIGMASLI